MTRRECTERRAHAYARERGVSPGLYAVVKVLARVGLRAWFRFRVTGTANVPERGAVIIAPNHKNFLDAFFVGLAVHRHVRYMAKVELFKGPLAWLFPRLGAFPVRRGEADAEALRTAASILADGGLVVIFPEGTRVEAPDALGSPHHGAGRLALETGAPIVPAAITGTSHLWRGALPHLRRVQLAFLDPVPADRTDPAVEPVTSADSGADRASALIDEEVWPAVQREYGRLLTIPGAIAGTLAAVGLGTLVLRRQRSEPAPLRLLGKLPPRRIRRRSALARVGQSLRDLAPFRARR
jgi:1-acyl-sn-glycerol-3-phosphate acyltransferase